MKSKILRVGAVFVALGAAGAAVYSLFQKSEPVITYPPVSEIDHIDRAISELSQQYQPEAIDLLKQLISIPKELDRIHFLRSKLLELCAVRRREDIVIDEFGNLIWHVTDEDIPIENRKTIFFAGHIGTGQTHPAEWSSRIGLGISPIDGLTDIHRVDEAAMRDNLAYLPRHEIWDQLIFGRGACSQLQGIVSQIFATRILLETNSLRGLYVVSIVSPSSVENPGCGLSYLAQSVPPSWMVPNCVLLTCATGSVDCGPVSIANGHLGETLVEVTVSGQGTGAVGKNPLETGCLIINEAQQKITWTRADDTTDKDCACFTFRTILKNQPISVIENLSTVKRARLDGFDVTIEIPSTNEQTWSGHSFSSKKSYLGWSTPPTHPSIFKAVECYRRVVTPNVTAETKDSLKKDVKARQWNGVTDGTGMVVKRNTLKFSIEKKDWIEEGEFVHPPMFGVGVGYEENCNAIGEYVDGTHLWSQIAFLSRYPSLFLQ